MKGGDKKNMLNQSIISFKNSRIRFADRVAIIDSNLFHNRPCLCEHENCVKFDATLQIICKSEAMSTSRNSKRENRETRKQATLQLNFSS